MLSFTLIRFIERHYLPGANRIKVYNIHELSSPGLTIFKSIVYACWFGRRSRAKLIYFQKWCLSSNPKSVLEYGLLQTNLTVYFLSQELYVSSTFLPLDRGCLPMQLLTAIIMHYIFFVNRLSFFYNTVIDDTAIVRRMIIRYYLWSIQKLIFMLVTFSNQWLVITLRIL